MKRNRKLRGTTLIETMTAAWLTGMVLTTGMGVFMLGLMTWTRGKSSLDAEMSSHTAIQVMVNELRQAMVVTIDSNGLGVTFFLPQQTGGTDVYPPATDGVTRRIELDGSTLNEYANGVVIRKLCSNVILTDPLSVNGTGPYQIFTPGAGLNGYALTVMLVNKLNSYEAETVTSRNREAIYLRNVPQLQ